eukprot:g9097.t1
MDNLGFSQFVQERVPKMELAPYHDRFLELLREVVEDHFGPFAEIEMSGSHVKRTDVRGSDVDLKVETEQVVTAEDMEKLVQEVEGEIDFVKRVFARKAVLKVELNTGHEYDISFQKVEKKIGLHRYSAMRESFHKNDELTDFFDGNRYARDAARLLKWQARTHKCGRLPGVYFEQVIRYTDDTYAYGGGSAESLYKRAVRLLQSKREVEDLLLLEEMLKPGKEKILKRTRKDFMLVHETFRRLGQEVFDFANVPPLLEQPDADSQTETTAEPEETAAPTGTPGTERSASGAGPGGAGGNNSAKRQLQHVQAAGRGANSAAEGATDGVSSESGLLEDEEEEQSAATRSREPETTEPSATALLPNTGGSSSGVAARRAVTLRAIQSGSCNAQALAIAYILQAFPTLLDDVQFVRIEGAGWTETAGNTSDAAMAQRVAGAVRNAQALGEAEEEIEPFGWTRNQLLHIAVVSERAEMVEVLLRAGADPLWEDKSGWNARQWAEHVAKWGEVSQNAERIKKALFP